MKKLIRTFKQISILILAITFLGCGDDDTVLPKVVAGFTHTINADTGTVTFVNTTTNANKYEWAFGEESSSTLINPVKTYPNGTYTIVLTALNVAGSSDTFEDTITILITDADAPVITLLGDATINILVGADPYTDPGATATDDIDGDITANIVVEGVDAVDVNIEGTYTITYNVSDSFGNAATEVTRTVIVANDVVAPVITLIGDATMNVEVGGTFTDPGATAMDDVDGDITANIVVAGDLVDTANEGSYMVTYDVTDAAGNAATQVIRTVEVSITVGDCSTIIDFENNLASVTEVDEFETAGALIANPVSGGINTSANVYEATYDSDNAWWGGIGLVFGNLVNDQTTEYTVKLYSTVAPTNVLFQVEVGGTNQPVGDVQTITTANQWVEVTFTLANIPSGANRILVRPDVGDQTGTKPNAGTLYIDNILDCGSSDGGGGGGTDDCTPPAGELLANGGFETDTCWQFNNDSGTSERSTAEANTGTFSARLVTGAGQVSNIKMEGFATNVVAAGDVVQVALKYKFTTGLGTGSQVKIEGFTEKTEGADPQNLTIISQSPTLNQWIDFTGTFTVTAGLDASRGISLLILLEGSGNADGAGEIFFDDVQVTKL